MLETRQLLTVYLVYNALNGGIGSLRNAINEANAHPGPDTIAFPVPLVIKVTNQSLPAITDPITIDGTTVQGYNTSSPLVTVNFNGRDGFRFNAGSQGSTLKALSLVNAKNAGVTLNASHITLESNYIGLASDGKTVLGNRGDGVQINASSRGNVIGHVDPIQSVGYYTSQNVPTQPVSLWQGIRGADTSGQYYITGTSGNNGLLFDGTIDGHGSSYTVNYPSAETTSVYGVNNLYNASQGVGAGHFQLVGVYKNADFATSPVEVNGFVYQGTVNDLNNPANYETVDYPGAKYTYVHSAMGGLAVGNFDGPTSDGQSLGAGQAFIYDLSTKTFTLIQLPGATSVTAYGIWQNADGSYTICGGYSVQAVNNVNDQNAPIGAAYLVDYDPRKGFTNFTGFNYPNGAAGTTFLTHFEGISGVERGIYNLVADSVQVGSTANLAQGSVVEVRRNDDGTFGVGTWEDLNFANIGVTSANSIYGNAVVGIAAGPEVPLFTYQAQVNVGTTLSNVISGNGGNGIGIYGSSDNIVSMNEIGTDVSGTQKRGNGKNGILITGPAAHNLIGGVATSGNNPTNGVFYRPAQGNIISGNKANGLLITKGATANQLSGNFIGTTVTGEAPLGNKQDGVAIVKADGNGLIGCSVLQDPFIYYNVVSGNGANGVRVTDSDNTTIQANFLGVDANNSIPVPNARDGLLVSGRTVNTVVGGVIPLGNVISGNTGNGIEVTGSATKFLSFNTFAGVLAFGGVAANGGDGILITASGKGSQVLTSILSGNHRNGLELGGNATDVQISNVAGGTVTAFNAPQPNFGDGLLITGHAHDNIIGGFQESVAPQDTFSSNLRYGIEINGSAYNNHIFDNFIGVGGKGQTALPNRLGGIYVGPGTSGNVIGGRSIAETNKVYSSFGAGIVLDHTRRTSLFNNDVQSNPKGGIVVLGGSKNTIGSADAGNSVTNNGSDGIYLTGNLSGTVVQGNKFNSNQVNGIELVNAQNLLVGGPTPALGNSANDNQIGYGLIAVGNSSGTTVANNVFLRNAAGNVNLTNAKGIKFIP